MKTISVRSQICSLKRPVVDVQTAPLPPRPHFSSHFCKAAFSEGLSFRVVALHHPYLPLTFFLSFSLSKAAETHWFLQSDSSIPYVASQKRTGEGLAFGRDGASDFRRKHRTRFFLREPGTRGALCAPPLGVRAGPWLRCGSAFTEALEAAAAGGSRAAPAGYSCSHSATKQLFKPRFGLMMGSAGVNAVFILPRPSQTRGHAPGLRGWGRSCCKSENSRSGEGS